MITVPSVVDNALAPSSTLPAERFAWKLDRNNDIIVRHVTVPTANAHTHRAFA
jgi:hypothetical protein